MATWGTGRQRPLLSRNSRRRDCARRDCGPVTSTPNQCRAASKSVRVGCDHGAFSRRMDPCAGAIQPRADDSQSFPGNGLQKRNSPSSGQTSVAATWSVYIVETSDVNVWNSTQRKSHPRSVSGAETKAMSAQSTSAAGANGHAGSSCRASRGPSHLTRSASLLSTALHSASEAMSGVSPIQPGSIGNCGWPRIFSHPACSLGRGSGCRAASSEESG